ncbi:hypothetical protein EEL33_13920 [Muribaculaceae bacterium Isolate-037 (Harlan)]|jgi:hypothetical protein|nr:hypothetical protein EEL33_13920 [Muribaculaceae bacterium Isolate-037 (Harlan)]
MTQKDNDTKKIPDSNGNSERKEIPDRKGILAWIRDILHLHEIEKTPLPSIPPPETVTTLINRAAGNPANKDDPDNTVINDNNDNNDNKEKKECCPYALKRNIVASLQEIRRFAEKHDLAATMIRALLTLLAEMAIGTLKGKVSENVLEALLKIFSFERMREEAYRQGELDGRNARIIEEHFPAQDSRPPHLTRGTTSATATTSIFSIAKDAGTDTPLL